MGCDVMTVNELYSTEIDYLQDALADYEWVLHHNYNGGYAFAPGIIYNPVRLEKLSDGIFWLSDPEAITLKITQGKYWYFDWDNLSDIVREAAEHRCCVWAKFRDKVTGYSFCYFATHPETRGSDSDSSKKGTLECLNAGNIRSLAAQVPLVNTEEWPVIIAGDMNTYSGHVSYTVFASAGWTDSFTAATSAKCLDEDTRKAPGTDVGTGPVYVTNESRRIDFVLHDGFEVCSYRNIFTKYNGIYPSDHLPVRVELSFSNI
jgi:endonuclease/exonuclease/phosphatase family metal-dependent hydrolase